MTLKVCFHGAESTGKSVLAQRLSEERGWPWVPEYGRLYCEEHGTDLTMADLVAIAEGQDAANRAALASHPAVVLFDTDQLMTAAWAEMLFGEAPGELFAYPKADLYLMFDADVPWINDGTRFFGEERARAAFAALAEQMLVRAGVPYRHVTGSWDEREAQVERAIAEMLEGVRG